MLCQTRGLTVYYIFGFRQVSAGVLSEGLTIALKLTEGLSSYIPFSNHVVAVPIHKDVLHVCCVTYPVMFSQ
jgi:hypothetical protein